MSDKTVLVVDDDESIQRLVKNIFENNDWTVYVADNGLEGYKKALKLGLSGGLDLIVSDMDMPELNGLQMKQRIDEAYRNYNLFSHFILMSGNPRPMGYIGLYVMKGMQPFFDYLFDAAKGDLEQWRYENVVE